MISVIASRPQYRDHIDPIVRLVPESVPEDVCLVAGYGDMCKAERSGFRRIVLAQHGAGQSYSGIHPSYPGGKDNDPVGLFLVPNEHAADRWRSAYPRAAVEVVGCPRLDTLPNRRPGGPVTVAVSFHWEQRGIPEARSAFGYFRDAIEELAKRVHVIGHSHPHRHDLARWYRRRGIEFVATFDEVCKRADVYVCDNSSTIFEFASTGRPVVLMDAPWYRTDVHHGLRFWSAAHVGIRTPDPGDLPRVVALALEDGHRAVALREDALREVYAYRHGGAKRAAEAIEQWSTSSIS